MKTGIFIIVLFLTNLTISQISLPELINNQERGTLIQFGANYDTQSSSLNNNFTSVLLKGGVIDGKLIDEVYDKQRMNNRLGRTYSTDLLVAPMKLKFFGSEKLSWVFESSMQSFLVGSYSKAAFGLTFYGNSKFLGDTARLDGTYFQEMSWQTIGAGFIDKRSKSYITLNLVNVSNSYNGEVSEGYLYTSADSTQLAVGLTGEMDYTYKTKFSQGLGVCANLAINFLTPRKNNENLVFQLKVQNLGVSYLRNVITYHADTAIQYDGFTVKELLTLGKRDLTNFKMLDTLQVKVDTIRKWNLLPSSIQFGKIINTHIEQKIQAFYGVKVYPFIKYLPKIYAGADIKIKRFVHLGLSASYGGFGKFRMGLYANYNKDKFYIGIGTEDMYGAISKAGFGQMINLRMVCVF